MAEAAGVGVSSTAATPPTLFGEDQGRYLIACNFDQAEALMIAAAGRDAGPVLRPRRLGPRFPGRAGLVAAPQGMTQRWLARSGVRAYISD
jgi:hypothetical protein